MMFVPISFVTPSNSFSSSFDLGDDRRLKTGREFTPPNRMEEAAAAAAVAADDKNATGLFRNSGGGIGRTASLSFEDVVEKDDISSIDSGNAAPLPLRSCSSSNFLCSSSAFLRLGRSAMASSFCCRSAMGVVLVSFVALLFSSFFSSSCFSCCSVPLSFSSSLIE